MKVWTLAATLLVTVSAATAVFAVKALTPKVKLEKAATHVVVGKVISITFTTNQDAQYATTIYAAVIAISGVEKGDGLKPGDVVEVRYVSRAWRGSGSPPPFDSGHSPRPKENNTVRAYLVSQGYNGAGYTTGGHYDVYYKNGFEILR
jgi:hypothetical protein